MVISIFKSVRVASNNFIWYSKIVILSGSLCFDSDNSYPSFQKEKEKMSFKMLRHFLITRRVLNLS